jgi:hypothetical protein
MKANSLWKHRPMNISNFPECRCIVNRHCLTRQAKFQFYVQPKEPRKNISDIAIQMDQFRYTRIWGLFQTKRDTLVLPEVFTAVGTKMAVFWVVAPCSLVEIHQRFRDSSPWWWRQQGPLKWWISTRLHGATTQKTAIFVIQIQFMRLIMYAAVCQKEHIWYGSPSAVY